MANEPKINLALVGEMPETPVRGTVYMSPDTSGNFVKVGVDGSVRTIFDGSDYVRKDESVWIPGHGEKSAVLANDYSYAEGEGSVSHGFLTYARGANSHAEGAGWADYAISVRSDFSNNIIYGANNVNTRALSSYIGLVVRYTDKEDVYAEIINAYSEKRRGVVFVLDKPLLDDGSDFTELTEVYLLSSGVAAGRFSHTEGDNTVAAGNFSHAEGCATYAGRPNSHAEGVDTTAYGDAAHAEGGKTLATGDYSHAEGNGTMALGHYSHAEGTCTTASGDFSHAEGGGRELSINISGRAGATLYTVTDGLLDDVKVGDVIRYAGERQKKTFYLPYEKGNPNVGFTYAIITGVHIGKDKEDSYIEVDKTLNSSDAIINEHASILQGIAEGIVSHSEGYYTNAIGNYSHSEGANTRALGEYSHAEGESTTTFSNHSHTEGVGTTTSGKYSRAEGSYTTASGQASHAEGSDTTASGDYSHAEGISTTTSGRYSHAEGSRATTFGDFSHAEGEHTTTFGYISHAEGVDTTALGRGSHTEGEGNREPLKVEIYGSPNTTTYTTSSAHGLSVNDIIYIDYETDKLENEIAVVVSVDTSTQFTMDNTLNPDILLDKSAQGTYMLYRLFGCAYGSRSHVEGVDTITLGDYSHAEGGYTCTSNAYEHAQGLYNISHNYDTSFGNSGNTLNSIGVGVSDASRSNVIEVMQNGDVYVKGVGSYDGSNYVDASTLQEVINDGGGSADLMISVTYDDLVDLVDSSSLLPGMRYRMIDYDTKISNPSADSMHHRFDLILTALSENSLSENCGAVQHEFSAEELQGISADEAHYFDGCNLDAWQIKYSIDNDTDRFDWVYNGKNKEAVLAPMYLSSFDSVMQFSRDLSSDSSVSMNNEHWGNFIYAFTDRNDAIYYFDTSVLDGYNLCYYGYTSGSYAPANLGYITFTPSGFMSFDSDAVPDSEYFSKDQFSFRITPTGDPAFNYVAFSRDERYDNLYAAQGYDTGSGWYAYSYTKMINNGFNTFSFNFVIWHNDSSVDDLVRISLTDGDQPIFYKEPSTVKITYPPYAHRTAVIDGETVSMDINYPEDSYGLIALCAEDTNDLNTWGIKNMPFGFDQDDASMHVYQHWGNSLYVSSGYITEFREYTDADASSMISKGVIYDMTDEYSNNMPYDFKNIVYNARDENWGDVMVYTFSRIDASSGIVYDATLKPMDINITV